MPEKNILYRLGLGYTDQDLIDTWSLDPNKDIDTQMYDLVEQKTYDSHIADGKSEDEARKLAANNKKTTIHNHMEQLKIRNNKK